MAQSNQDAVRIFLMEIICSAPDYYFYDQVSEENIKDFFATNSLTRINDAIVIKIKFLPNATYYNDMITGKFVDLDPAP